MPYSNRRLHAIIMSGKMTTRAHTMWNAFTWTSILVLLASLGQGQTQVGVCYTRTSDYRARTVTDRGSRSISYSCGLFGWGRCRRTVYFTTYRTVCELVYRTAFGCCSGYTQVGTSCPPFCSGGCLNGGTCTRPNVCTCADGWIGTNCHTPVCQPECEQGECIGPNTCDCFDGYQGDRCRTDINECADGNMGGCQHDCTNTIGSYSCTCRDGFLLGPNQRTCEDINECLEDNGRCNQVCTNEDGSYRCSCHTGYEFTITDIDDTINADRECQDINECDFQNGNCAQTCDNNIGSYECTCDYGYILKDDGRRCEDIDECASGQHNCTGLAMCENEVGFFRCTCPLGYQLDNTFSSCVDIDECAEGISGCNQECTNTESSFVCSCNDGFTLGDDERICRDIDECSSDGGDELCDHDCVNTFGSYRCDCRPGFALNEDGINCSPLECPTLSAPRNGTISNCPLMSQTTGTQCVFDCDLGFQITGSPRRICRPDSEWTGSTTVCQPLSCQRLERPENGAVLVPCHREFGSSCTILCSFGYRLDGPSKQMCVLSSPVRTAVEWTDPPVCTESDPCSPNPCGHGGECSQLTTVTADGNNFECNCEGTGFDGLTCNRGILSLPLIPTLIEDMETAFEISATVEEELVVSFRTSHEELNVTPSQTTLSPTRNSMLFSLMGTRPGQYSLQYILRGPGSSSFDSPSKTPILVAVEREPQDVNNYFRTVNNEVGFLRESCCRPSFSYPECPMTTDRVEFHSTCSWNSNNPFISKGVVFARFKSLSLPLSISGIRIDYSEGSITGSLSPGECEQCQSQIAAESDNCYYYDFDAGDVEDLLNSHSLAVTYIVGIHPLFPSWASVKFPSLEEEAVYEEFEFLCSLAEQEDVSDYDGCNHIAAEEPGLYSILRYNRPLQLRLDNEQVSSSRTDVPICFAVNLCKETQSPIFIGFPSEIQDTIKHLPVLQPYVNRGWSFSLDSVTLYNTRRRMTVSSSYWNGLSLYSPILPDADLRIVTTYSISYNSVPQSLVKAQLDSTGSLFYLYDNSDERDGLFEGNTHLTLVSQISGIRNRLILSSTIQSIIHTSGSDTGMCSQGTTLKMTYTPRVGQEFFSRLFSLEDETPQCDMDVFVNIDHALEFHGLSLHMNEGCPRLQLNRLIFPLMSHDLYFTESQTFRSSCRQEPNIDLGITDPVLSIRSRLRGTTRLPLGSLMTLYQGPGSVALSVDYSANNPGFSARMHSVDVSILGTVISTPIDIQDGVLRFTSQANLFEEYPAEVTVTALSNVPWNRITLSVVGKMEDSFRQNVEQYIQNYITTEIVGKALQRKRNAMMVVERANANLVSTEMKLVSEERNFIEANRAHREALLKVLIAENAFTAANRSFDTANTDVKSAQRALNEVCQEDECQDIEIERTECKTCYQDDLFEETFPCDMRVRRTRREVQTLGYRNVRVWRYVPFCYDECSVKCFFFWSTSKCRRVCRSICTSVIESEPIREEVEIAYFEVERGTCTRSVFRMTTASQCCESYFEQTPDVTCIQGCRMQRQRAISTLEETREDLAEPFQRLDTARNSLLAARTTLSRADAHRKDAERRFNQAMPPFQSAQTVQNLSEHNRMRLLSQIENELKLAQQLETEGNNIGSVIQLVCITFNTEIATASPVRIPMIIEYVSFAETVEKTVVFDLTSSFELNVRRITEEIVEDLLNTTSRATWRSVRRIFKRQTDSEEDTEIREREQNEVNFEENCVDLTNIKSYMDTLNSNLNKIESSIQSAKNTLKGSIEVLRSKMNIDPSEFFAYVNFESLENLFNISESDASLDPDILLDDQLVLQYKEYLEVLIEIAVNSSDAVDATSFMEWQASMEMLHNESLSAAGYPCTGFTDCLEVVVDVAKQLIEDLPSQYEKQALHNDLENAEVNFTKLATSRNLPFSEVLLYATQMSNIVNTNTLSTYWCSTPPNITESPPIHINISSGSDLILNCSAESSLPTNFHWNKDGAPIPNSESSTLVIENVQRTDEGNYTCHVANAAGRDESVRTSISVYILPSFFLELSPIATYVGNETGAWFACNASSYPYPGWRWYFRPTEEDPWTLIEGEDTNELRLLAPQTENEGWYTCEAFNYHGSLRATPVRLTLLQLTVSQLGIGVEFRITRSSLGEGVCSNTASIEESIERFTHNRIELGAASMSAIRVNTQENGFKISFELVSQNVTNEETQHMTLSEIENIALPSRGDVSRAREALQSIFLRANDVAFLCNEVEFRPQRSTLTFNTITYKCPPGQELHSNFLICVGCAQGSYQGMKDAQRIFEGEGVIERFPVCKPCRVSTYQDTTGSTECNNCPDFHQTSGPGSTSQQDCIVDPLLFECSPSGTTTQVTIDCKTNRPPAVTLCSFDGGQEHKCKLPLLINKQTSIPPGNHSVVLTARDSFDHMAQETVNYFLSESDPDRQLRPSLPRLGIRFINDSPRLGENTVEVDFILTRPASKVTCQLGKRVQQNCSSGSVVYSDLHPGKYFVRVQASNAKEDRAIERRSFEIPSSTDFCSLHLINDGITVSENYVTVDFASVGPADSFECQLDGGNDFECTSPVELDDMEEGDHRLRITPQGCHQGRRLTYKFTV